MLVTSLHLISLTNLFSEKDYSLNADLSRVPWTHFGFDHLFFMISIWLSPCAYKFVEIRDIRSFSNCALMLSPEPHTNILFYHGSLPPDGYESVGMCLRKIHFISTAITVIPVALAWKCTGCSHTKCPIKS